MYVVFFVLWLIFAGEVTLEITCIGLVVAAAIFWFVCRFMDYNLEKERRGWMNFFFGLEYVFVLIWEILKANINVMKLILSPKYEVEPAIVRFRTDLKTNTSKVVLANSITLTPGTITVSLEEDEYVVHCLDKDFAEGMEDSLFVHLLKKIESKGERKISGSNKTSL